MRWGNIGAAFAVATYVHLWAAALAFRFDESAIGVCAVFATIVSAVMAATGIANAHEQAEQDRRRRVAREAEEEAQERMRLVPVERIDKLVRDKVDVLVRDQVLAARAAETK